MYLVIPDKTLKVEFLAFLSNVYSPPPESPSHASWPPL